MEIIIQKTAGDYQKFSKYYFFSRKLYARLFFILLLAIVISGYSKSVYLTNYLLSFVIISMALFLIFFVLPYFIYRVRLHKALKTKTGILEKSKITLTDFGIKIESDSYSIFWTWEAIKWIENRPDYIFIHPKKKRTCLIIPKLFFNPSNESNIFYEKVQINVLKTKGSSKVKNGGHLYYWGLVGFLPNFGVIAGAILLYKGVYTYKNKKLITIGIADILFTIIFWIGFTYQMNHGSWFNDVNAKLAQTEVNSIVKDIEFFKMKNGNYPDSLVQVEKNGQSIFINDPFLQATDNKMKGDFHYKRIRNKYTLFSVGADRSPNTVDDIYPTVTLGDTLKFGLIKQDSIMSGDNIIEKHKIK